MKDFESLKQFKTLLILLVSVLVHSITWGQNQTPDFCLDIDLIKDKFSGISSFESPSYYQIQFVKIVSDKTTYNARFMAVSESPKTEGSLIILLDDGSKIEKRTKISVNVNSAAKFVHSCSIDLSALEVSMLLKHQITDVRLGIKDYSVDHPLRYQAYLACLKSFTKTDIDPKRKQRDFEPIEVRTLVEEMPKFPGGDPAFLKLLREKTSPYKGASGVVYVSYVVDQVGQIRNVKVLRGLSTETDSLATHIIKNLTGYKPGYEAGIPVPVQFTIPIRFE
jgi:hypothetical protein